MSSDATQFEGLLRDLALQVLGALVRRYGDFGSCEDAVQEALLAAAVQWPLEGVPTSPRAWLIRITSRRRIEQWRNESARQRREEAVATLEPPIDQDLARGGDDGLMLLFLCCHPSLTPPSQVALTLRAVGGLTTTEIARAYLVPEATIGSLSNRRVWADLAESFPDGITLDAEGAVWHADVPGKRCVRVAERGRVLQTVELDRGCFACTLGGSDGATLLMLAAQYPPSSRGPDAERTGQVLSVQAPAPRAGWP